MEEHLACKGMKLMYNHQQAEQIVEIYLKKLYSYALNKTANLQDAQDLVQDIILNLYSALLVKEIHNLDAFVWRLAHNVLVNYYRGKAKRSIGVSIEELEPISNGDGELSDNLIEKETIKKLRCEIAYLSKSQREILIMYYYDGKKLEEIADILKLPLGTVKWHLFNARNEIKKGMGIMRDLEHLKFNPIKFSGTGVNGSIGTMGGTGNFFRSVLAQNIAYSVYREAKSINEIADCLGVSPVYVESEAEFLEEYGFLIKKGDKYLANIIIEENNESTIELVKLKEELYEKAARLFANELFDELMDSQLLSSGQLYYPDGDKNFLAWGLVPYLLANCTEGFEEKIRFEEVATIRKDGAHNIAFAYIDDENAVKDKYYESMSRWCGPMWNAIFDGSEKTILWQVNSEWSDRDTNYDKYSDEIMQRDIKLLNRFVKNEPLSGDELAYMAKKGYIKGNKDKYELAIIWLKNETIKQQFVDLSNRTRARHLAELEPLKEVYSSLVLEKYPKHIQKMKAYGLQYTFYSDGKFLLYSIKELLNNGKLKMPKDEQRASLSMIILQ